MELNRKLISIILVVLIIVIPVSTFIWVVKGPTRLDSLSIDAVATDVVHLDGVRVIGSASGSGGDFEESVSLLVYHENEQVYSGKAKFSEGYMAHKLLFEDFSVGNGKYEFRIVYNEFHDEYDFELDVIVEELGVVSSATYNYQDAPELQPWQQVYVFHTVFRTGWHFFTHRIDRSSFRSYDMGSKFEGESSPLRVECGPDHGIKVEVWFTDQGGVESRIDSFDVDAGKTLDTVIDHDHNGSYLYKYVNERTVDVVIKAYEDRPVDKLPTGGKLEITQEMGTQTDTTEQIISRIDQHSGHIRPKYGPGDYTFTIAYDNPMVKPGTDLSTVIFTETRTINDLPKANPKADPPRLTILQRTITFDATDSFDDGPVADLWIYWSAGSNAEGEIGSVEGPWEDYKTWTFKYPPGEDPNVLDGKPFLILKDAFGAESEIAYVNLQVS